jgi:hypothetical protein
MTLPDEMKTSMRLSYALRRVPLEKHQRKAAKKG